MLVLIGVLYALFASTFTLAKAGLAYAKPLFFVGTRMMIAGTLLLGYLRLMDGASLRIPKSLYWLVGQAVLFHIFIPFTLEFSALASLSSAKSCLLYSLSPFIAALYSYIWFGERLTVQKAVGLSIGFAGFLPTLLANEPAEQALYNGWYLSSAELMLIGAVVSSTYGWIVVRRVLQRGYSPLFINGYAMVGGGALSLLTSLYYENIVQVSPVYVLDQCIFMLIAQILVASIICYNLYGLLLQYYTATFLSFAGFLCPLFATFFGYLFLHEPLQTHTFITIGAVALGLYLFYQEELRQGYVRTQPL